MSVENGLDELWIGVKGQTNLEIAGTPRNIFRYSVWFCLSGGRALIRLGGFTAYQPLTNSECYEIYSGVRAWVLRSMSERERTQTIS